MINYTEQEERARRHSKNCTGSAVTVGIILVIIGCIIVLSNTGIIPWAWKHFLISWQMLLIALGIVCFSKGDKTAGTVLVLVGGFFILPKLNSICPGFFLFRPGFTKNFWPLLIVACGLGLIVTSKRRTASIETGNNGQRVYNTDSKDGYINYNFTFNGAEQVFLDPVFKGGVIKATFGGVTLDLRKTSLPEDGPTTLVVDTTFGGVTLMVPEHWNIEIRQNSIFGGFTDKRFNRPAYVNGTQKLIIDAKCTFGGGEIK